MSLLEKASLVLTPNAYKASKLYSVVPSSGLGDMTVTRATTATRVNSLGLIESVASNVPRLNYDVAGGCPSILLEPQRTNLLTYSEDFINASWVKSGVTVTADTTTSPDNTIDADTLTSNVSNGFMSKSFSATINTTYTFSFWVKSISSSVSFEAGLLNAGFASAFSVKTVVTTNDWQRIVITGTSLSTQNALAVFGGGGTFSTSESVYIWGAQLEQGAYATSYIPTVASTVTRNVDDIAKTSISSLLNPSEGTFYVEAQALANDSTTRSITLSDGSDYNQISIQFSNNNQIRVDTYGKTGPTTTTNFRYSLPVATTASLHKIAIVWGPGGIFGFIDGAKYTLGYVTGTIGGSGIPTDLTILSLRAYWGGSQFFSKTKLVGVWKTALTDTEMIQLTTL